MKDAKVFGIGFHKTGTTSLAVGLAKWLLYVIGHLGCVI